MKSTKNCENCGVSFVAQVPRRRFCGNRCQALYRERSFSLRFNGTRPHRRTITREQINAALMLCNSGKTVQQVAEETGISTTTLVSRRRELGYRGIGSKWHKSTISIPSDPEILAYIAGIVDGEGCITFGHQVKGIFWRVTVVNTSLEMLNFCVSHVGGKISERSKYRGEHGNLGNKPIFSWNIAGQRDVLLFLKSISPFMIIKRERALRAISEIESVLNGLVKSVDSETGQTPSGVDLNALLAAMKAL